MTFHRPLPSQLPVQLPKRLSTRELGCPPCGGRVKPDVARDLISCDSCDYRVTNQLLTVVGFRPV